MACKRQDWLGGCKASDKLRLKVRVSAKSQDAWLSSGANLRKVCRIAIGANKQRRDVGTRCSAYRLTGMAWQDKGGRSGGRSGRRSGGRSDGAGRGDIPYTRCIHAQPRWLRTSASNPPHNEPTHPRTRHPHPSVPATRHLSILQQLFKLFLI